MMSGAEIIKVYQFFFPISGYTKQNELQIQHFIIPIYNVNKNRTEHSIFFLR